MKILNYCIFLSIILFGMSCTYDNPLNEGECKLIDFNTDLYENGPVDNGTVVNDFLIHENCLELSLSYSGGCRDHDIDLAAIGWIKTDPPQINAKIIHNNDDDCEAYITETIEFDLIPVRYDNAEKIIINIEGFDEKITHTYTQ